MERQQMNTSRPTILMRLRLLNRTILERIAQQCVVEAISMSQLRKIANEGLAVGNFLYSPIYGRTPLERTAMVNCVMRDTVAPMPLKKLCTWIRELADSEELMEALEQ